MAWLSVLIVTYNSAATISHCLDCLHTAIDQAGGGVEVIIWDNASGDNTARIVRAHPLLAGPDAQFVASRDNLSFGGGNNAAAALATAPLLLLLNPDAYLEEANFLRRMLEAKEGAGAAICGPKLLHEDGRHQVGDAGYEETLTAAAIASLGLAKLLPVKPTYIDRSYPSQSAPLPVDWVCGACLLVEAALYRDLGGFDPAISLYSEDVDLCLRAGRAGVHITYVPALSVRHVQGVSTSGTAEVSTRWLESRFMLFHRTHGSALQRWLFALFLCIGFAGRGTVYYMLERISAAARGRRMSRKMQSYATFAARYLWKAA